MKWEYELGERTGIRACPDCWDEDHPQLDTRDVKTNDKQSVPNSRSDSKELATSRALSSFNPVGGANTSTHIKASAGRVTV